MIRPFFTPEEKDAPEKQALCQEILDDADAWAKQLYDNQYVGDYLAKHGYVVFSADAPMWGERGRKEGVDRNKYDLIAGNMMMLGRDLSAFMSYDVFLSEFYEADAFHVLQYVECFGESALLSAWQVYLRHIASDNHLCIPTHTGEKHSYLCRCSVLRLVENHYGIAKRAASHEGERSY